MLAALGVSLASAFIAGVGTSPPGLAHGVGASPLRVMTVVEGLSLDIRQQPIALGHPGVSFRNEVDVSGIIGPGRYQSSMRYDVTASDEHTAHAAGLLIAVAGLYGGRPSAAMVAAYFDGVDDDFLVRLGKVVPIPAGGVGPSPLELVRLLSAVLSEGPGGGCLMAFEGSLCAAFGRGEPARNECGAIEYPPNPCEEFDGGDLVGNDDCLECGIVLEELCPAPFDDDHP